MLDVNSLLYVPNTFVTSRYNSNNCYTDNTVSHFDHYISCGHEIVSAPVYVNCSPLSLPTNFIPTIGPLRSRPTKESNTFNDKPHFLVLVTMFLTETNEQLMHFYDYYRLQGVTKFFMFYNGDLTNRIATLPNQEDIIYQQWNYGYWQYEADARKHHCQYQAITTGYYKYGHVSNYVIVCDTDEFIKHPSLTIKEYVESTTPSTHFYIKETKAHIDFVDNKILINSKTNNPNNQSGAKSIYPGPLFSKKYSLKKEKHLPSLPIHVDGEAVFCPDLTLYHNKLSIEKCDQIVSHLY